MDLADRYLNTKTVEYACRADLTSSAETVFDLYRLYTIQVVDLFLRDKGNPISGLADMQACWFELGMADSFSRQGKYGRALKMYKTIEKVAFSRNFLNYLQHYDDFQEDMMDFHAYSMRKTQLRAYVDTLKWQDDMRDHKWYFYALMGAARVYSFFR